MKAMFKHNCNDCQWLGSALIKGKAFDAYICTPKNGKRNIVARFSDEPGDYASGLGFVGVEPCLTKAFEMAILDGYGVDPNNPEKWLEALCKIELKIDKLNDKITITDNIDIFELVF